MSRAIRTSGLKQQLEAAASTKDLRLVLYARVD